MSLTKPQQAGLLVVLALVMAGTRINHFSALPDASWTLFFVAGFYLRNGVRWAFPILVGFGVLVDFLVISSQGLNFWNHYCVSAAYWFLIPAYAAMWMGGALLRAQASGMGVRSLGWLALIFPIAFSAGFLISNGSFYWLSDVVAAPSVGGWLVNLTDWYLPYLRSAAVYVCVAVAAHVIGVRWLRLLHDQRQPSGQRG
jgi:hypothetical protein